MKRDLEGNRFEVIRKIDRWLLNIENLLAGVSYAAMVAIVFAGVIMRYALKVPNLLGEEISRYLMVSCVFIGIAAGCRQKVHLSVELFVNLLPGKLCKAIKMFTRAVVVVVYGYMTYQSFLMVEQMHRFGQTSPAMRLPLWIMYAVILLGFGLSMLTEIVMYIDEFFFDSKILNQDKTEEVEKV